MICQLFLGIYNLKLYNVYCQESMIYYIKKSGFGSTQKTKIKEVQIVYRLFLVSCYRVSHSEMNDSKWLCGVEGLRSFLNYGD